MIGAEGQQLGIVSSREAKQIAFEADLDLVEISPTAEPGPNSGPGFIGFLALLVAVGLFLSWKGYGPED